MGHEPPEALIAALTSKDVSVARKAVLAGNAAIRARKQTPEGLPKTLDGSARPDWADRPMKGRRQVTTPTDKANTDQDGTTPRKRKPTRKGVGKHWRRHLVPA